MKETGREDFNRQKKGSTVEDKQKSKLLSDQSAVMAKNHL